MNFDASPDPELLLHQARLPNGVALGQLLEMYRGYLALLARLQIGRRLQGKIDAADLVQEIFLEAPRHFNGRCRFLLRQRRLYNRFILKMSTLVSRHFLIDRSLAPISNQPAGF
jgi:hypothetical protein